MTKPRDYKHEYAKFHSSPADIAKRSSRNKARRKMIKLGRIGKGDSRDVDHINANALNDSASNLRAISVHLNRSRNNNKNHPHGRSKTKKK